MNLEIREYRESDRGALVRLLEELQDVLIPLDPLKKLRRLPSYGQDACIELLKNVATHHGEIVVADSPEGIIGFIAGIQEESDALPSEWVPSSPARILELHVSESARGKGVGSALMEKMVTLFRAQGCDLVRVGVLATNAAARAFYEKNGYGDRMIDMIKVL